MLKDLNVDQARFVALLAKAARAERDALLGHGLARTWVKQSLPAANATPPPRLALIRFRWMITS